MRLIDADALKSKLKIDTNTATCSDYCNGYCDARQVDLYAINAAPAVNRWIPCSERMPEDNAEVLVSFCRRYVKIGYIEPGDWLRYWVIPGHSVVPLNYIEAWMPMPDAYEPPEKE